MKLKTLTATECIELINSTELTVQTANSSGAPFIPAYRAAYNLKAFLYSASTSVSVHNGANNVFINLKDGTGLRICLSETDGTRNYYKICLDMQADRFTFMPKVYGEFTVWINGKEVPVYHVKTYNVLDKCCHDDMSYLDFYAIRDELVERFENYFCEDANDMHFGNIGYEYLFPEDGGINFIVLDPTSPRGES